MNKVVEKQACKTPAQALEWLRLRVSALEAGAGMASASRSPEGRFLNEYIAACQAKMNNKLDVFHNATVSMDKLIILKNRDHAITIKNLYLLYDDALDGMLEDSHESRN